MKWDMMGSDASDAQYERAKAMRAAQYERAEAMRAKPVKMPVPQTEAVIKGMNDDWGEPPKWLRKEVK